MRGYEAGCQHLIFCGSGTMDEWQTEETSFCRSPSFAHNCPLNKMVPIQRHRSAPPCSADPEKPVAVQTVWSALRTRLYFTPPLLWNNTLSLLWTSLLPVSPGSPFTLHLQQQKHATALSPKISNYTALCLRKATSEALFVCSMFLLALVMAIIKMSSFHLYGLVPTGQMWHAAKSVAFYIPNAPFYFDSKCGY